MTTDAGRYDSASTSHVTDGISDNPQNKPGKPISGSLSTPLARRLPEGLPGHLTSAFAVVRPLRRAGLATSRWPDPGNSPASTEIRRSREPPPDEPTVQDNGIAEFYYCPRLFNVRPPAARASSRTVVQNSSGRCLFVCYPRRCVSNSVPTWRGQCHRAKPPKKGCDESGLWRPPFQEAGDHNETGLLRRRPPGPRRLPWMSGLIM